MEAADAPAVSGICVSEQPLVNAVFFYHHLFAVQPAAEEEPVEAATAPAVSGICVSEEPLVNAVFFIPICAGQPAAEEEPVEAAIAPAVSGICVSEEPLVNAVVFFITICLQVNLQQKKSQWKQLLHQLFQAYVFQRNH